MSEPGAGPSRGVLEEIGLHVPGFKGYLRRELRRDADRAQRDFLAGELKRVAGLIDSVKRDLAGKADFARLPAIDGLSDRFSRILSRVRSADSGYSGFFDTHQIGEAELAALYEQDLALIQDVRRLQDEAGALSAGLGDSEFTDRMRKLDEAIAAFDAQFDRRREILKGAK